MPRRTIDSVILIAEQLARENNQIESLQIRVQRADLVRMISLIATRTRKGVSDYIDYMLRHNLAIQSELDPDIFVINKDAIYRYR